MLGVHASEVDWTSGPGLSLLTLVSGLLLAGVTGRGLLSRHSTSGP